LFPNVIARSEATWQSRSSCEESSGVAIPLILSLSKDANENEIATLRSQ
jgi:hypothetical protein